jgi:hypothetical protein
MSAELYQWIAYLWIAIAVLVFFVLLRIVAPYGRHASRTWGPVIPSKLGWLLMETPVLIVFWVFILSASQSQSAVAWVMIALFTLHYINRSFVYPLRIRATSKEIPVVIVASGVTFNLMNGLLLGYYFAHFGQYADTWMTDFRFITGVLLFAGGMYINWKADARLIALRGNGDPDYKIPRGWLFEKISCPNHFGEIIEWLGFALLTWSLPALAFAIWTIANLVPRALAHHKWYKRQFDDYPVERKAVIPFVM